MKRYCMLLVITLLLIPFQSFEQENYHTPEQTIPSKPLPYPWESCMTLGDSWSYVPKENFKSTDRILENLVNIVSRGGNYLLNVAPGPDGEWHEEAYQHLSEIGEWMKVNGVAIYNTRPLSPYVETQNVRFTKSKEGNFTYCFIMDKAMQIRINALPGKKVKQLTALGHNKKLSFKKDGSDVVVDLPADWKSRIRVIRIE